MQVRDITYEEIEAVLYDEHIRFRFDPEADITAYELAKITEVLSGQVRSQPGKLYGEYELFHKDIDTLKRYLGSAARHLKGL